MTSTEESWTSWFRDLVKSTEEEDYDFFGQSDINGVDEALPSHHDIAPKPPENSNSKRSLSTDSTMSNSSGDDDSSFEKPAKALKTSTSNSAKTGHIPTKKDSPPSSCILSFNNANPTPMLDIDSALTPKGSSNNNKKVVNNHGRSFPAEGSSESQKKEPRRSNQKTGSAGRSPQHARDHIIAERMRREKISQQFIALSALIPGLKKMDKATVLGDAIKYVKQLQEQVKLLEEQGKRKSVESLVYVEKSQPSAEEDVSDTSSNSGDGNSYDVSKASRSLPEVEARVSEKNVLIRIHCEKQKGVLMYVLKEIEKLRLSVVNSSSLPFGTSIVDITITAEMEDEFSLGVKELARNLRGGLLQFM